MIAGAGESIGEEFIARLREPRGCGKGRTVEYFGHGQGAAGEEFSYPAERIPPAGAGRAVYSIAYSGQSVSSTRTGPRSGATRRWWRAAAIRSPASRSPR
ncbi:hypothetical protein HFP43_32230 [Streptomyces sp. SJ1-7]|nr:hypothetical protein [Streptomyces sp. SJ1-7]